MNKKLLVIPMIVLMIGLVGALDRFEFFVDGDDGQSTVPTNPLAQTFIVGTDGSSSFNVTQVGFKLDDENTVDIVVFNITGTDSIGEPNLTDVITNGTMTTTGEVGPAWFNASVDIAELTLGKTYSLIFSTSGADTFKWRSNSASSYPGSRWIFDGTGQSNTSDQLFEVYGDTLQQSNTLFHNFNSNATEATLEYFSINISVPSHINFSSAQFFYNNTAQTIEVEAKNDTDYTLNTTFVLPLNDAQAIESKFFYWNITYNDTSFDQVGKIITVQPMIWQLTDGDIPNPFLNLTFKNETTNQEWVEARIIASEFVYWLDDSDISRTFTHSNSTGNNQTSYSFNVNRTANVDYSITYDSPNHEGRTSNPPAETFTSTTTERDLFLLPTSDGIFVTFQVVNSVEQPVSGATITLSRSSFGNISVTTTGSSGTSTVFLNPDISYTITVVKSGFDTFTATQAFPTSEFTISLGGSTTTSSQDLSRGIFAFVRPRVGVLNTNTTTEFKYSMNSSFYSLDSFGFVLHNSTGGIIVSNSSTNSVGGILNAFVNTGDDTSISMNYYWEVNETFNNRTISWAIRNHGDGSISGFFQRLSVYMDNGGFFGMDVGGNAKFVFALLIFGIIFSLAGILAFRFGITSTMTITIAMLVFVIALTEIGIFKPLTGTNPIVSQMPAIIAGIIILMLMIRGISR